MGKRIKAEKPNLKCPFINQKMNIKSSLMLLMVDKEQLNHADMTCPLLSDADSHLRLFTWERKKEWTCA